jgi:hypothetical protein
MAIPLSEVALNRLNCLKKALNADESAILEQAKPRLG